MPFSGPEMVVVLIIVLVLFGGSSLPKLARNLGKAQKEFKDGMEEANKSEKSVESSEPSNSASNDDS